MPPGDITDHMELVLDQLRTNSAFQADFQDNPADALTPFDLTTHERDALVTRDCDDLKALGLTNLPSVLGCPQGGGFGRLAELIAALRERLKKLLDRGPDIPDLDQPVPPPPPPEPEPIPPPGPGPLPRPTPGPDPPGPDRPGPGG